MVEVGCIIGGRGGEGGEGVFYPLVYGVAGECVSVVGEGALVGGGGGEEVGDAVAVHAV